MKIVCGMRLLHGPVKASNFCGRSGAQIRTVASSSKLANWWQNFFYEIIPVNLLTGGKTFFMK